jgi:hypothetical protein
VPMRAARPPDVTALVVPGRPPPLKAASTLISPFLEVPGRPEDVPTRTNPVAGRPPLVDGRTPVFGPVRFVPGRAKDVPGRGVAAVAFSSRRRSATPWGGLEKIQSVRSGQNLKLSKQERRRCALL